MTVHLKPELETLVTRRVDAGAYGSVDEFVDEAVRLLSEQEEWLSANHADISAMIDQGMAAAERGDLLTAEQVRAQLAEKKSAWIARQS